MKQFLLKNKILLLLTFITVIGATLRFYNLNWGNTFYFHPDERNIANSVIQLQFPYQMNPHFFAYGSLPIYVIYFSAILQNFFTKESSISFPQAIIISRFYSALLAILIIPSLFFVVKQLMHNKKEALLTSFLGTTSVGFLQFAHFGTFEMWLTFLSLWFFYFCLKITKKHALKYIFISGCILGLLVATKISSLALVPLSILAIFFSTYKSFPIFVTRTFLLLLIAFPTFFIFSPFTIIDFSSFLSSNWYEASVATGTLPVFYTQGFFGTTPIISQLINTYPFLLNPALALLFLPALFYVTYISIKKRNIPNCLLLTAYCLLFIPQAILFAKWTRYMVPTLPFLYIIIAIFINEKLKNNFVRIFIFTLSLFFALAYFSTVFLKPDTRVEAAVWASKHITASAKILSESYDLGIIPFNSYFTNITLFNFYDEVLPEVNKYDYLILPSQRVMKTRLTNRTKFPGGNKFYTSFFQGKLGFVKVYETPCNIFCKITYLGDPVFSLEETANVFDRPTIFIFKKIETLKIQ